MSMENAFVIEFENDGDNFEYCKEVFEAWDVPVQKIEQEQGPTSYRVEGSELADSLRRLNQEVNKAERALKEAKRILGE